MQPRKNLRAQTKRLPMARVERLPLIEREIRERVGTAALELLIAGADVLVEGAPGNGPTSAGFFGSVMMTIDLAARAPQIREAPTPELAARLVELIGADGRALGRIRRIAESRAAVFAGRPIEVHPGDLRVRSDGLRVLVDIDIEAC
jgi:hypothetical protein